MTAAEKTELLGTWLLSTNAVCAIESVDCSMTATTNEPTATDGQPEPFPKKSHR